MYTIKKKKEIYRLSFNSIDINIVVNVGRREFVYAETHYPFMD